MAILASSALQEAPYYYELIHVTDNTTETTGSITLLCRDKFAEPVAVNRVKFLLNGTSACDLDLRDRTDMQVIEVDSYGIKFNLTGNLEGKYTCGIVTVMNNRIIAINESMPVTLICKLATMMAIGPMF